jgi:hypothetical protein
MFVGRFDAAADSIYFLACPSGAFEVRLNRYDIKGAEEKGPLEIPTPAVIGRPVFAMDGYGSRNK